MAVGKTDGLRWPPLPGVPPVLSYAPDWVEHDPEEIWAAVVATLADLLAALDEPVAALGLTNQRETVVVWDRRTGEPRYRALVWQDRRGAPLCAALETAGYLDLVRTRTGLVLDPYFSASKLAWLLTEGGVAAGPDLAFGTVDSWLRWRLTVARCTPRMRPTPHAPCSSTSSGWPGIRTWRICSACRYRSCRRSVPQVAGSGPPPPGSSPAYRRACRSAGRPATSRLPSLAKPASTRG